MRNLYKILGIILLLMIFLSCQKKPVPPAISTTIATEISAVSAVSGGNITNDGGAPIISKGICWNTATDPTISNNKTNESGESLSFTSNITELIPSTLYYVRAYATNSVGTSYGKSESFKTLGDKPVSNSQNASNIQLNSATLNGNVNPNSLSTTVSFEYGITIDYGSAMPAVQSPLSGNLPANVSVDLTGLTAGTTYHFRIKAENSLGITFSSDLTFTSLGQVPTATPRPATNLQINSATLNGDVNPNLLSTSTIFEWGLTTSYGSTVTAVQSPFTGSTSQAITASLSGLSTATTYHFRIKAENSLGITYSSDLTFKTLGQLPTVTILPVSNLQIYTATLNGTVNANYLSTSVAFEWGTTASYGSTIVAIQSPVSGNTTSLISSNLPGLTPGTTYHFRIKAENSLGITFSNDMTFTTLGQAPSVTALDASATNVSSATLNGSVNPKYLSTTAFIEWGTTSSYGNLINLTPTPLDGNTNVNLSTNLTGLIPETKYHYRIVATNELATSKSNDITFTTYAVADIENNLYHSVTIGTQIWLVNNLKTSKFNDGTSIPLVTNQDEWKNATGYAYCWYNNNTANKELYGALYNRWAVDYPTNGNKKVCPSGWHIPAKAEWSLLLTYLIDNGFGNGGSGNTIAKSMAATIEWNTDTNPGSVGNNLAANNRSGFTALPGGMRTDEIQGFIQMGVRGSWWAVPDDYSLGYSYWCTDILNFEAIVYQANNSRRTGLSIRCLKD